MSNHSDVYEFIAAEYRKSGDTHIELNDLLIKAADEGYGEVWQISKHGMANALAARGLELKNGVIHLPRYEGGNFDPVVTDYEEFLEAAKEVMDGQTQPLETMELVSLTGLTRAAVPLNTLASKLQRIGVYFIPGVGYWNSPSYTLENGKVLTRRCRSDRLAGLLNLFEIHGWPIAGRDAEAWSNGLVTSRFMTIAANQPHARIAGIGSGLYVPVDRAADKPLPMTPNIADKLLELDMKTLVRDKPEVRFFRILKVLERLGIVKAKHSRSTHDGKRCQSIRAKLTKPGRIEIKRLCTAVQDEF